MKMRAILLIVKLSVIYSTDVYPLEAYKSCSIKKARRWHGA